MPWIKTRDRTDLYVKDWGSGRPVILIHGWPLNADSFDRTAMKLAEAGHRVINYDRRGLGRSGQPWQGYDWDSLADDLADVMRATGATEDVTVIGYSMGGGEAARYMSRHGGRGVIKVGLYASVAPGLLQSESNPHGNPASGFDDIKAGIEKDVAAFFRHTFLPPFYGRSAMSRLAGGHAASDDVLEAAVNTALMAGMKPLIDMAHAFSFGDFVADMPAVTVPTLIVHGAADKPVPIDDSARRAHRMIPHSQLIEYDGHPHGLLRDPLGPDDRGHAGLRPPVSHRTQCTSREIAMPTVAELLVQTLADVGVRQVFGVVGDALNPLSEAVRKQDRIEWIGVHHEEGAALAAAAQAKLTGQLGVCCGTTGPGANHLVAGLYEAEKDHAPVLAISGGVPADLRGIDYRQENAPNLLFRDVAAYTDDLRSGHGGAGDSRGDRPSLRRTRRGPHEHPAGRDRCDGGRAHAEPAHPATQTRGDGGFFMLLGEFMTAVGHRLPVKVVVYDNQSWGLVHLEMEQIGNPIAAGANLRNPDFAALAKASGAHGFTVRHPRDIGATVGAFLAADGPAVLHAHVAADERPITPRADWATAAKMGLAKVKELFVPEPPAT